MFSRQHEGARRALQNLLDGPLTFTPIETPEGNRYHVQGRVTTGALLSAASFPQWQRPQGDVRVADTRGSVEILALLPLSSIAVAFVA